MWGAGRRRLNQVSNHSNHRRVQKIKNYSGIACGREASCRRQRASSGGAGARPHALEETHSRSLDVGAVVVAQVQRLELWPVPELGLERKE